MTSLNLKTSAIDARTVLVAVEGEVHFSNVREFQRRLADPLSATVSNVIVDLSGVPFMDSSGLSALIEARRDLGDRGGRLVVVHGDGEVSRIFRFKGVDRIFDLVPTSDAAMERLGAG